MKKPDHQLALPRQREGDSHRRVLLRERGKGPCDARSADEDDELAPLQSIESHRTCRACFPLREPSCPSDRAQRRGPGGQPRSRNSGTSSRPQRLLQGHRPAILRQLRRAARAALAAGGGDQHGADRAADSPADGAGRDRESVEIGKRSDSRNGNRDTERSAMNPS